MAERPGPRRLAGIALVVAGGLAMLASLQALSFFRMYAPRLAEANQQVGELIRENADRRLRGDVARLVEALARARPAADAGERTLTAAFADLQAHFVAAPLQAIERFRDELPGLMAGSPAGDGELAQLEARLARLQDLYSDRYRALRSEMQSPPAYLWPTAPFVARRCGYLDAATFNRALFLAQTGDIGTARVLLAGLQASARDAQSLAAVLYTLGRLQTELFRTSQEAEYFGQAVQFLQQSVAHDSELRIARRLLDYLLSLSQAATAPQSAEGRPETPSEGEGAAISPERRIF